MTVVIPMLMSMLLGSTIDLTTYNIGIEIYDFFQDEETPRHVVNSTYTVLQENVLPYSTLGVPSDIVLKIKSDVLRSPSGNFGLDGMLKKSLWNPNSVIIAVTSVVETAVRELKKDARLLRQWLNHTSSNQTHYVHAQVYGGWIIILHEFQCEHSGQAEEVRKILTSIMGVSGSMDEKAVDLWEKALVSLNQKEDLRERIKIEVKVYSSHLNEEVITSPVSTLRAVQKFNEDLSKLRDRMFVELKPLHELNPKFPIVTPQNDQAEFFLKLDKMYDDVKFTKISIRKWMSETDVDFTEEQEERIFNLYDHVGRCMNLFQSIADEESIYKSMDKANFDSAYFLYRKGLGNGKCGPETYRQMLLQLREDLDPECKDDFSDKISAFLELSDGEEIDAGKVEEGLEGCKTLCLQEPKCRSIRYAEKQPVVNVDPENPNRVRPSFSEKQCWLQFRSSRTAKAETARFSLSGTYDRNCSKTKLY